MRAPPPCCAVCIATTVIIRVRAIDICSSERVCLARYYVTVVQISVPAERNSQPTREPKYSTRGGGDRLCRVSRGNDRSVLGQIRKRLRGFALSRRRFINTLSRLSRDLEYCWFCDFKRLWCGDNKHDSELECWLTTRRSSSIEYLWSRSLAASRIEHIYFSRYIYTQFI